MESLLEKVLKEWKGHKVAVSVGGDHSFTGTLEDFDEEVILLKDVVDVIGNRGKQMLIGLEDINWIMLLE
ncbi:hypothetical protein PFDSM3638_09845 [Pyrococcus furiosus DSM 3638]|nr:MULTISPECIES: LSm family protein [Pyrococcus]AFN04686.1 hypothetical protein PFC_08805 [Pyrococcus furiosus COM1]MDK2869381.1 hypothetical protein [Pyrococcus sp.]QEK79550.1 hypothetical protein PFDSM3638_09845 [Pyrococcus furiosus DSM 3638]